MTRAAKLAAVGVFAFLWLRPAYTALLRRELARDLPQAWAAEPMNGSFRVLVPELMATRYHDEALYAARVNQVLVHGKPYNPYWREERGARSWLHQNLAMYLLAAFAAACGGDVNLGWWLAVAVLGAGWFLLFHAIFLRWCGREEVALPLALFSILFPDAYFWLLDVNFSPAVNLERWSDVFFQSQAAIRPNFYRLPSNFLSLFLFSLLWLGAWRLLARGKDAPGACFALGLGVGALAFVHAFTHVFAVATLGVLVVLIRLWREPAPRLSNSFWLLGGALTASAGYAWIMASVVDPATAREALILSGLKSSRHFYLVTIVHLVVAALALRARMREPRDESARRWGWLVLAASQLGIFLCRNMQVIAGVVIQPHHFIPLGSFTGALLLMLWLSDRLARAPWWDRRVSRAAAAAMVVLALANEKSAAERTYRLFGLPQATERALDWIAHHVAKDGLVMSLSAEANETVPLYTSAKVQAGPSEGNQASPFTREVYFRRVAGLLKTLNADPGTFLRDRWLPPASKNALLGRIGLETRLLSRVDLAALEPAMWFYPQYAWDESEEPVDAGKARIIELCRIIKPQPKPYWLWLGLGDEQYLTKSPEAMGGRLVYMNSRVKLYAFE